MRTDSNSVLSLSSGVPPKKPISTKSPSKNGEAFSSDFNKAKDTLDAKKNTASDVDKASSSASAAPTDTTKKAENAISSNDEKGGGVATSDESPASTSHDTVTADGGKTLQPEGENAPSEEMLPAVSVDQTAALASASTVEVTADSLPVGVPEVGVDGVVDDKQVVATYIMPPNSPTVGKEGEAENTSSITTKAGANILGLSAIKQAVVGTDKLVKEADIPVTDSADAPGPLNEDGSLSWVLSQMEAPVTKASALTPNADPATEVAKATVGVAAGVIAGANKDGRNETVPLSLMGAGVVTSTDGEKADSATTLLDDGFVLNEPIELRKKEQEAMIGRMAAQVDGNVSDAGRDDNALGGLNSSLQNNANRAAVVGSAAAMTPQNNLTMSLPPGHPGWANEMSQKVAWIARDGGHTAHIRLDPPELGSLTVKVSVDSDSNTQISFVAATPQARDLLEGQMGRLREMLAQQGMDLSRADVDVSQQDTSGAQDRANNRNNGTPQGNFMATEDVDEDLIPTNLSYVSASGVDYYA